MASLTIRQLDEKTKARLRIRAARHRCSMEEEARRILRAELAREESGSASELLRSIRRRFEGLDITELQIPAREPMRKPPKPGR